MRKPLKVLFVEDSQDDMEMMLHQLRRDGFDPDWKRVDTEADFLEEIKKLPDIIVSDYSLPRFSGLKAARLLQESLLGIPLILVSGTIGEEIAVEAMKMGATDYVLKDRIARLGSSVEHALQDKQLRDERKKADALLLESKLFLRSALDALSSCIAILDEQGAIIEVNAAWNNFAINDPNQNNRGVGANYLRICQEATGVSSEEAADVAVGIAGVIAGTMKEFQLEYPCHAPNVQRWFVVRVTRFAGEGPVRVVVAHERITERKQAELELLWKTTLLEAQLESTLDGILVLDGQGRQVIQNRRMIELWKIPRHIVESKNDADQVAFARDQTKNPVEFMEKIHFLQAHPDEVVKDVIELKDGTILDRYSARIQDQAGRHQGRIWSFRDITENRKLEAQFVEAQKMESIGQLAGGIAHDFNNILAALSMNLCLAQMDVGDNLSVRGYLEQMTKATSRAGNLVNQILTFSRQNKQEREPINLNTVVNEALKLLRASVPTTVRIQIELTETPLVMANSTAIHQLIMNLGTNAWHAMRDKPGLLKVDMGPMEVDQAFRQKHPGLHLGKYVCLSVSDTGAGMSPETLQRIFEPFFTTKAVGEGTGLGLAVVHGIMKSHEGGVYVRSQPGEGTCFDLFFPALDRVTVPFVAEPLSIPRGNGERILFVDDEEALAMLGKKLLDRLGYQVTMKISALEALSAVREQPMFFDLVITDLTMPNMDGAKLGTLMRAIQPGLPIVISTGFGVASTLNRLRDLGFKDLLLKPASLRLMGEAVYRALHPRPPTEA